MSLTRAAVPKTHGSEYPELGSPLSVRVGRLNRVYESERAKSHQAACPGGSMRGPVNVGPTCLKRGVADANNQLVSRPDVWGPVDTPRRHLVWLPEQWLPAMSNSRETGPG